MSYTINCNNTPWRGYETRAEAIDLLKELIKVTATDGLYDELDYSENKGTLEIWDGEDKMIYTVRENK